VLRSGDHELVARWRRAQSLARTMERRPDLIAARGGVSDRDSALLAEFGLALPASDPGDPPGPGAPMGGWAGHPLS
jgi:hypothetical protein